MANEQERLWLGAIAKSRSWVPVAAIVVSLSLGACGTSQSELVDTPADSSNTVGQVQVYPGELQFPPDAVPVMPGLSQDTVGYHVIKNVIPDTARYLHLPAAGKLSPPRHATGVTPRPYRGRRFFGPFAQSSDFSQVKLSYTPGGVTEWYHNEFFVTDVDEEFEQQIEIYKRYYRRPGVDTSFATTALPGVSPATADTIPDTVPVRLTLSEVAYSNVIGGSVRLTFVLDEDYEIELGTGGAVGDPTWDVHDLEMRVYVKPRPENFNPAGSWTLGATEILVDLSADRVITYVQGCLTSGSALGPSNCADFRRLATPSEADALAVELETLLEAEEIRLSRVPMSEQCRNWQTRRMVFCAAARFAYAWMHAGLRDVAPMTHVITDVLITEGSGMFLTQEGIPVITTSIAVLDVNGDATDWIGSDEYQAIMRIDHIVDHWTNYLWDPEAGDSGMWVDLGERLENWVIQLWRIQMRVVTEEIPAGGSIRPGGAGVWTQEECVETKKLVDAQEETLGGFENMTDSEQIQLLNSGLQWIWDAQSYSIDRVVFTVRVIELDTLDFDPFEDEPHDHIGTFAHEVTIPCDAAKAKIAATEWGTVASDVRTGQPLTNGGTYSYRVTTRATLATRAEWNDYAPGWYTTHEGYVPIGD